MFRVPHGRYLAWVCNNSHIHTMPFLLKTKQHCIISKQHCYPTASNGLIVSSDSVLVWYVNKLTFVGGGG